MENNQTQTGRLPYEKPSIEVIELPESQMLLAQSRTSRDDYESEKW